ncbi:Integrase core domain-containing protein [Bradyrhizobium shewense]|uniref:Integrase core domain-containing protein n=1 Tax=Bradyrhizobium shewense TaxID=1761772 RepID=A0A1C3XUK8_9BRAD|nr:Integrase core domain-containing protein [Bradyrhizobium shewense]
MTMLQWFFHTLKTELVHHRHYARADATRDIFAYVEGFYNRTRRHSAIGYISPIEMELKQLNPVHFFGARSMLYTTRPIYRRCASMPVAVPLECSAFCTFGSPCACVA